MPDHRPGDATEHVCLAVCAANDHAGLSFSGAIADRLVARARQGAGRGPVRESEPRVLDLLNRVGADGWDVGEGHTYWDAAWSLTTYTFKRRVAWARGLPGVRVRGA